MTGRIPPDPNSTPAGSSPERAAGGVGDEVRRARDICLRLLTARPRTRAELHQALLRKEIDADVAEQVLARLDKVGLVDDAAFAEVWVRSRHTYSGLSRRALAMELRRKGVDESVTAEAVAVLDNEDEERRARQLVRKRLRSSVTVDETAMIRRLVGMLARKGYPEGLAFRVVREELRNVGADAEALDDVLPEDG